MEKRAGFYSALSAFGFLAYAVTPSVSWAQASAPSCELPSKVSNLSTVERYRIELVAQRDAIATLLKDFDETSEGSDERQQLELTRDLNAEALQAANEWLVRHKKLQDELASYRKIEKRLKLLRAAADGASPTSGTTSDLAEQITLDEQALIKACETVRTTQAPLEPATDKNGELIGRFERLARIALARSARDVVLALDGGEKLDTERSQLLACPTTDDQDTEKPPSTYDDPCFTRREALAKAEALYGIPPGFSASRYTVPGRVLDRRGVTSSLLATSSGGELSLGFKDEFRFRRPNLRGSGNQRISTIGYGLSLTTGTDPFFTRTDNSAAKDPAEESLDRLASDTKIGGTLSWNIYRPEPRSSVAKREKAMLDKAKKDCLASQKAGNAYPSTCENGALEAWIFAVDPKTGKYTNASTVDAWNAVYWGPAENQKTAWFGFGIGAELGWTDFAFYNGLTAASDLSAISTSKSKTDFSLSPYVYWAPLPNLSLVGQVAYKDEWSAAKTAQFCGPTDAAPDFEGTTENCVNLAIGPPTQSDTFVPSIEARYLFAGLRRGRLLIPEVGLAPKLSHDTETNRWEAEFPVYFVTSDGKLSGGIKGVYETGGKDPSQFGLAIFASTTFSIQP